MNEEFADLIVCYCARCGSRIDVTKEELPNSRYLLCPRCILDINGDDEIDREE
jgi:hypothetical protein